MNHTQSSIPFIAMGIAIRTTNKQAMQQGTIGQLWHRFFAESIMAKIPHKQDNAIIALYYDFETDYHGQYTLLLGARVSHAADIPAGMVVQEVPAQQESIFVTEQGPVAQVVVDLWQKIWTLEDEGKLARKYIGDYEVYDARAQDPANAIVAIHIGIE